MPKVSNSFLPPNARSQSAGHPANTLEGLIKIGAAAAILGVSAVTVRRRVADGSLPHIPISGRLYFKKSELHRYIEAHRGA
jgi:excisionase family DNA binding protein